MKRTPLKRKTLLRKTSKRRQQEYKEYMRLRKKFLEENPVCWVWLYEMGFDPHSQPDPVTLYRWPRATEIHHVNGRNGKNYLDTSTWMAVCREAHMRIENNKSWARGMGYLGKK